MNAHASDTIYTIWTIHTFAHEVAQENFWKTASETKQEKRRRRSDMCE